MLHDCREYWGSENKTKSRFLFVMVKSQSIHWMQITMKTLNYIIMRLILLIRLMNGYQAINQTIQKTLYGKDLKIFLTGKYG